MYQSSVSVEQRHLFLAFKQWVLVVVICFLSFGLDRVGALVWFRGGLERGILVIDTRVIAVQAWLFQPIDWWTQAQDKSRRLASLEERLAQSAVDQQKLKDLTMKIELLEPLVVKGGIGQKASKIAQLVDYQDRVILGLGESGGIIQGQILTDKAGILVGKISRVGRYMSEVALLNDIGSRVQVQTVDGKTKGIVEGKGSRTELVGVLQTELLQVGDVLVTSGSDAVYPPGLVVGQVTALAGKPEDVTKGGAVELLSVLDGWVAIW